MGGIQYPKLNQASRNIWQWCEKRNIWIFASYIASKENVIADRESRREMLDTEWELSDWAFNSIVKRFGYPKIDLFAARTNKKHDIFCSWKRDPEAFVVDAFTISWSEWFFHAFPPFAVILRTVQKIIQDKACGVLVVPLWHAQPWFPLIMEMLTEEPIVFKPSRQLLICPSRFKHHHPLAESLSLMAGRLSGRRM